MRSAVHEVYYGQVAAELIGGVVDVGEPLVGQGLDSLASMELRQKLQVDAESFERTGSAALLGMPLPQCAAWPPSTSGCGLYNDAATRGDITGNVLCAARRPHSEVKLPVAQMQHSELHFLDDCLAACKY
jgi:hypothetical protein